MVFNVLLFINIKYYSNYLLNIKQRQQKIFLMASVRAFLIERLGILMCVAIRIATHMAIASSNRYLFRYFIV